MIRLAIAKGRVLKQSLPLLDRIGLHPIDDITSSRKLIFPTKNPEVELIVIRGGDVPTYVQFGAAELGIAGKDVLLEHGGARPS